MHQRLRPSNGCLGWIIIKALDKFLTPRMMTIKIAHTPTRVRMRNARGVPISRAFCASTRRASHPETTAISQSPNQGSPITVSQIYATMPPPAPQGREPSGNDGHSPKSESGLRDYCDHCYAYWAIILAYFLSAEMNSSLSSLAYFMIEINVPFASSG